MTQRCAGLARAGAASDVLRRRDPLGIAAGPVGELVGGHRAGDAEALNVIAAKLREYHMFTRGLDAFCKGFDSEPFL